MRTDCTVGCEGGFEKKKTSDLPKEVFKRRSTLGMFISRQVESSKEK